MGGGTLASSVMYVQDKIFDKSRYEPFDVMCSWRFDGSEDEMTGRLVYDGHGVLTLHVMKTPGTGLSEIERVEDRRRVKRVVGVLDTGESVVLGDVYLRKSHLCRSLHTVERSRYRVRDAFVGDQIIDTEKFDGISVTFTGLLEWMNPSTTKTNISQDKIALEYKRVYA